MNILIAGASRGIGLGLVNLYLERGARVFAAARNPASAEGLTALAARYPDMLTVIACDLNELTAGSALRTAIGDAVLDRLVFNAGVKTPTHQEVTAVTLEETALLFTTNAIAPVRLAQQLADLVAPGGVIGFTSSQMGSVTLNRSGSMPLYGASKAALNSLVRSWVATLEKPAFSVLALHPGWVRTDMGGPNAAVSVEESAAGLVNTMDSFAGRNTEAFVDYLGHPMPW